VDSESQALDPKKTPDGEGFGSFGFSVRYTKPDGTHVISFVLEGI
jgi:hypothetical protein